MFNKFQMHHAVDRYRHDAHFKALTDQLFAFMCQEGIQPYEVRDAAFVAEVKWRETFVHPILGHYKENTDGNGVS